MVERLAEEIDKVDLIQNDNAVFEKISEGGNLVDIPVLSGHHNQNITKAHAAWKRNARKHVEKKGDGMQVQMQ